ncbi:endospore germination permease [Paenibacillus sp. NPDC058071]|uniref:endospore germination permease n=1 Tax=Paenibacillus sp. NPDC058071 TaxID=3346326 RepID=UPI0036DDA038
MKIVSKPITIWMAFSILLLSAGLVCHVFSISAILDMAGRDGWISILVASPFFLLFVTLLFVIIKRLKGQRLPDWIAREFGVFPSWLFRLTASLLLLMLGAHTLFETSNWSITTYLQFTPVAVVVVSGAAVSALAAFRGLRSIAMTSSLLLPVVLFLGYFVMTANTKYKDYHHLLPIMDNGMLPVWKGAIYALGGLVEIWILMLYSHEVKKKIKWWHLVLLAIFMIGMTIGPTLGAITEFGPEEASKQRSTPFEQWKLVSVGKLLQHVDFLSIYQWLSGSFARIAISIYLIVDLLDIRRPRKRLVAVGVVTAVMCGVAMYWWRIDLVYEYVNRIQFPIMLIYVWSVTFILALLTWFKKEDKEAA